MKRAILLFFLLLNGHLNLAQEILKPRLKNERFLLEGGFSLWSEKYRKGQRFLPMEAKFFFRFSPNAYLGIFSGYSNNVFSVTAYSISNPLSGVPAVLKQETVPVGLCLRLDFTELLKGKRHYQNAKRMKWSLFTTSFAGYYLTSYELLSLNGSSFSLNENIRDSYFRLGMTLGLQYWPHPKFALFTEGGIGILGNANAGFSVRF